MQFKGATICLPAGTLAWLPAPSAAAEVYLLPSGTVAFTESFVFSPLTDYLWPALGPLNVYFSVGCPPTGEFLLPGTCAFVSIKSASPGFYPSGAALRLRFLKGGAGAGGPSLVEFETFSTCL